jgi:hypothetical protein
MNDDQIKALLKAVTKMADTADTVARIVDLYVRTEKDPRTHATYMRIINAMRDASLSLKHTLNDAPAGWR